MADSVNGVVGVSNSFPAPSQYEERRAIPESREQYLANSSDGAAESNGISGDAANAAVNFVISLAFGEIQRGLATSKRMQDESHAVLKESQNEDN